MAKPTFKIVDLNSNAVVIHFTGIASIQALVKKCEQRLIARRVVELPHRLKDNVLEVEFPGTALHPKVYYGGVFKQCGIRRASPEQGEEGPPKRQNTERQKRDLPKAKSRSLQDFMKKLK